MFQRILLLALFVALIPTTAVAKSTQQRVDKLVAKYAVQVEDVFSGKFRPKVACVCNTGVVLGPGFVVQMDNPERQVVCAVGITYDAKGEIESFGPCEDFIVLSR